MKKLSLRFTIFQPFDVFLHPEKKISDMKTQRSSFIGHVACFIAYAIFGVNIVTCKDMTAGDVLSPLAIFCFRAIGAGGLFWIISLFMPRERVENKDYIRIFIASMLGFFGTQMTFLIAIRLITPMESSIVSSMSPIFTMIIAAIALHEPITTRKAGGVALSFAGIVWLIISSEYSAGANMEMSTFFQGDHIVGILLILANCIFFSLYLGIFRPLIGKYHVVTFMKWIFLFSLIPSLPFAIGEMLTEDYAAWTPSFTAELLYLIVCATFISYFLIPVGQKRIRPTLVSMYSYVQPIIAIAISIWIGMDELSWGKVIAAVMVFGGLALVTFSRAKS